MAKRVGQVNDAGKIETRKVSRGKAADFPEAKRPKSALGRGLYSLVK